MTDQDKQSGLFKQISYVRNFRDLGVDFWDTILSEKGDPAWNSLNAIA